MLRMLAATPGETVPRLALAGNGAAANERAVDVQVNRLRRKIERDPANPLFVQTVRGIGYRLVVDAMTSARHRHRHAALARPDASPTAWDRLGALDQQHACRRASMPARC